MTRYARLMEGTIQPISHGSGAGATLGGEVSSTEGEVQGEGEGWYVEYATQATAGHITPVNDIVDHTKRFCICKPRWKFEPVSIGIVCTIIHNSLDGREGTWVE